MRKKNKFAIRIKEARLELGLSQYKMADFLGVTQSTIAKWELNMQHPNYDDLLYICDKLKTSVDYLLGFKDY